MRRLPLLFASLLAVPLLSCAQASSPWQLEPSETTADLRGVHAVGGGVVWASGTGGTVLRSQDSGFEWQQCAIPSGAETLDFRAIWAWDDQTAVVMSSGTGALSRIYKTTDGCAHWTLLYTNPEKDGFWDALVFESRNIGTLLGDPVHGRFQLFGTKDGGRSWTAVAGTGLEAGPEVSGAFAASNSSLLADARDQRRFGTGGALVYSESFLMQVSTERSGPSTARSQWKTALLPLAHGNAASGIFALARRDSKYNGSTLLAVGGDYTKPDQTNGTAAWSWDGGQHWIASSTPPGGYRSAVAWEGEHSLWLTIGPNGSDVSRDDGRTWQPLEHAPVDVGKGGEWNALSLPWAVGPHGRIGKLNPGALGK